MPKFLVETNQGTFEIEANREPTVAEIEEFASGQSGTEAPVRDIGDIYGRIPAGIQNKLKKASEGDVIETEEYGPMTVAGPVSLGKVSVPSRGVEYDEVRSAKVIAPGYEDYISKEQKTARINQNTKALTTAAATSFIPGLGGMAVAGGVAKAVGLGVTASRAANLAKMVPVALGGAAGGVGTALGQNALLEEVAPGFTGREAQEAAPGYAIAGSLLGGNAPYQKIGFTGPLVNEVGQRLLGAGIGGGIAAGLGGGEDEVMGGVLGGALFNNPTGLGRAALARGASMVPNKAPITSKLGNASTDGNIVNGMARANEIAMPQELPGPTTPPLFERPSFGGLPDVAGAPPANAGEGLGQFEPAFQPQVLGETEIFNKKVQGIVKNLSNEGVELDRQTAVKLARLTDRKSFNAARQSLIDSVKTMAPEVPSKGPIPEPSLESEAVLPVKAQTPPPLESAKPAADTIPEETHISTVVKTAPEPNKLDFVGIQEGILGKIPNIELWNISKDIVDPSGKVLHPKGSTVSRQTLEGYGIKVPEAPTPVSPNEELVRGVAARVDETVKEVEASTQRIAAMAPEPVLTPSEAPVAPETPIPAPKPVKAKETPIPELVKSPVIESPLLKIPSRKKQPTRVDVDDEAAIEAAAAAQAGKAVPAEIAPKQTFTETAKVKYGNETVTIGKTPNGDWVDASGNILSGGSKQVAVEKVKAMAKAENPKSLGFMAQPMTSAGEPLIGAAVGYVTGDTPEDRLERAKKGFAIGAAVSLGGRFAQGRLRMTPRGLQTLGAAAFHGTPHKVDKFSKSKIGTGEGSQVYGHGLYFAENPEVAKSYADKLGGNKSLYRIIDNNGDIVEGGLDEREAANAIRENKDAWQRSYSKDKPFPEWKMEPEPGGNIYEVDVGLTPENTLVWDKPLSQQSKSIKALIENPIVSDALDKGFWSKKTMEMRTSGHDPLDVLTGSKLYSALSEHFAKDTDFGVEGMKWKGRVNDEQAASEFLDSLGIKGISYADQGSRGTEVIGPRTEPDPDGKFRVSVLGSRGRDVRAFDNFQEAEAFAVENRPTQNFVVFDDSLIKIVKENDRPVGGVQGAGEAGIIYNPFSNSDNARISQAESIRFAAQGDGTYEILGFKKGGTKKSDSKPAKYGSTEMPFIRFIGDESEIRQVLGDEVTDRVVRESSRIIFEEIPEGKSIGKSEVLASGRIEGLTSANFRSKFSSEGGSVLNPFENLGQPTEIGRKALDAANEPLLQRMATADVEATNPKLQQDPFGAFLGKVTTDEPLEATPAVEFEKPGVGRKPTKESAEINKQFGDLLPTKTFGGEEIPENIKENGRRIYEKLVKDSGDNGSPPPTREFSDAIAKVPEHYTPFLTDLASRMPWMTKAPGGQLFSDVTGLVAKAIKNGLGISEDNIGDVSPRTKGRINRYYHYGGTLANRLIGETKPLGELVRKSLSRDEVEQYNAATLTGDRDAIIALFKGKKNEAGMVAALDRNQAAKAAARNLLIEAGRDVGLVDTYFERILTDREGLLKFLEREEPDVFRDAVKAAEKSKGSSLTDEEQVKLLNSIVTGSLRRPGGPGFLNARTIKNVTKEMSRFYEPADVADLRWSMKVSRDVANRKFFGKIDPEVSSDKNLDDVGRLGLMFTEDSSFGKTILGEYRSGAIKSRGLKILSENMTDLFNNFRKHDEAVLRLSQNFRAMQTFGYLADIQTMMTQFLDVFSIAREYGIGAAVKAYGKGMPKIESVGVTEGHNVDVEGFSRKSGTGLSRIAKAPFQFAIKNLLGRADAFQKSASLNAARKKVAAEFSKPDSQFIKNLDKEYSAMFGDEWPKIRKSIQSKDFANGVLDENSSLFLFSELARLQPITASGRAQGYQTAAPWIKPLYTLRSYWIKQLGINRNQAYNLIKRGNLTNNKRMVLEGFGHLASYATVVLIGQQIGQYLKDKMLGREVPPETYPIAGLLQIAGIPRYAIHRRKQVGTGLAALETLVPGVGIINDLGKDVLDTFPKYASGHRQGDTSLSIPDIMSLLQNLESAKYIPGVGREVYSLAGKGRLKEQKEKDRINRGGKPRATELQEIFNIFDPPDSDR